MTFKIEISSLLRGNFRVLKIALIFTTNFIIVGKVDDCN